VIFVLFIAFDLRPGQVVTDRVYFLKRLLARAIRSVLRNVAESLRELKLRQCGLALGLRKGRLLRSSFANHWSGFPAGLFSDKRISSEVYALAPISHAAWSIVDRERDL